MTKKAVILELDSSYVTLFSEEGEFIRLPARRLPQARCIGQNVNMNQIKPACKLGWAPLLAACIFILLVAIPMLIPSPAMAWVSLDNSSSLELLIDNQFKIKEIRPLNNGANKFLVDCKEESLTFPALVNEFIDWSARNGDNSLLVTATRDIQAVKDCINNCANHDMQVVTLEVIPKIRDEAGKRGLSAGRAIFMAEASCREDISSEKMKEGNPIDTLDSAGVNVDDFVRSLDSESQAEKIKDLPPAQEDPESGSEGNLPEGDTSELTDGEFTEPVEGDSSDNFGEDRKEKEHQGVNLSWGLAKKDKNHPGVQSISRSGSWGKKTDVPKGKQNKAGKEKNETLQQDELPNSGENSNNGNMENPGQGKGKSENHGQNKEKIGQNKGQDKDKSKGNPGPGKKNNQAEEQKGKGHDNRDKKNNGKNGKP